MKEEEKRTKGTMTKRKRRDSGKGEDSAVRKGKDRAGSEVAQPMI